LQSEGIAGRINTDKPAWQPAYANGAAELVGYGTRWDYFHNLDALRISPPIAKRLASEKARGAELLRLRDEILPSLEKQGWTRTENADGSVTYVRPPRPKSVLTRDQIVPGAEFVNGRGVHMKVEGPPFESRGSEWVPVTRTTMRANGTTRVDSMQQVQLRALLAQFKPTPRGKPVEVAAAAAAIPAAAGGRQLAPPASTGAAAAGATSRTGQQPAAKPKGAGGKLTTVRAGEQKITARWAVVDIGDLVTSHTENLAETPGYPQELQPRDRRRLASREQIADLANRLDPELMAENPLAQHGAPIVGPDRAVESGNARTIALRQAYRTGGKTATAYQEWLRNHAARFGIKPEAVGKIQQPILVRVRTTDLSPEERVRFTQAANARETAAMGSAEQAKVDASRLKPALLQGYDPSGELSAASNRAFMRDFIGTLPATEHAGMRTADGRLTQEALTRARNALFYHAYGDTAALVRLAEATDDSARNVTMGLLKGAGVVAELRDRVVAGTAHPLDIAGDVAAAAGKLASLRDQGVSVPEYLAQQSMFGGELDDFQRAILQSLETHKRSAKKIAGLLTDYVDVALKSGDPSTGSLFEGIALPTKAEVWEAAGRRIQEIDTHEPGLFTTAEEAVEPHPPRGGRGAGAAAHGAAPGPAPRTAAKAAPTQAPRVAATGRPVPPEDFRVGLALMDPQTGARVRLGEAEPGPGGETVWPVDVIDPGKHADLTKQIRGQEKPEDYDVDAGGPDDVIWHPTGYLTEPELKGWVKPKPGLRARRGSIQIGPALGGGGAEKPAAEPVLDNPELEAWRTANRVAEPPPPPKESLRARLVKNARNIFPDLPDNPQNRPLISALLRMGKLHGIAKAEAMFRLHEAVGTLSDPELQLLEGAMLVPDLLEDVEKGVDLPPGVTEEMLTAEQPKIEAKLMANPKVAQAARDLPALLDRTFNDWKQSLIDIGETPPALDRKSWFHHLVTDRMEEMAQQPGASKKLKAIMRPGFSFERKGGVNFTTYAPAALFQVMADAIRLTEENKVIRLVQDPTNGYNVKPLLDARRALGRDPDSLKFFHMLTGPLPAGGIDMALAAMPEQLGAMAVGEQLPDDPNGRWEAAIQALADAHALNAAKAPGSARVPLNPELTQDVQDYSRWLLQQYTPEPGRKAGAATEIPKGYTEYRFTEGNPLYRVTALTPAAARLAQAVTQGVEEALTVGRTDLRQALALGKRRGAMIVPEGVARTLNDLTPRQTNIVGDVYRRVASGAKAFTVLNPEHMPTLMREKIIGDTVRIFRANPDVFQEAPQAIADVFNARARKQGPSEEYRRYLFQSGGRGFVESMENIGADRGLNLLAHLAIDSPNKLTPRLIVDTLRAFPDRLDEILRYAAFRSFGKAIDTHGEPQAIGAARRDLAMSLKGRDEQAWFLANHLMGAYDEIPALTRAVRDHFPGVYWGFMTAQMRSETNLFLNAVWREPKVYSSALRALGVEDVLNQRRGSAWVANNFLFWTKLTAAALALAAYNRHRFPKEEQDMDDPSPHLDLGKGPHGTMLVWPRVGTLPNPAAFLGLDDPLGLGQMYLDGRLTKQEIVKRLSQSGVSEFVGLSGLAKLPLELATRRRLATGGRIDDALEYTAQQFHVPLMYEAARRLLGKGAERVTGKIPEALLPRPMRGGFGGSALAALVGAHLNDPGDVAFREAGAKAREWMQTEKGISGPQREAAAFTPLSASLYYYKMALRDGDGDTALKYLAAYARNGGADKKIHQQLSHLEPLYGLNKAQMAKYLGTLNAYDRNQIRSGYIHYQRFAAPNVDPHRLATELEQPDLQEFAQGMRRLVVRNLEGQHAVRDWLSENPVDKAAVRQQARDAARANRAWKLRRPAIR
jgi:hypothetical protein